MSANQLIAGLAALLLAAATPSPAAAPQLAGRTAEEWIKTLDTPARIAGLKIDETIARLRLRPGAVVADIGAGAGVFEKALADAVAPGGKVYAVDIDRKLLDNIERRAKEFRLASVVTVLGTFTDPALPAPDVDVAFIHDVLHHIENRADYLKNLAGYLNASGRIVVIDFVPGKGGHQNQPELQVTKEQTTAWMAAAGLKPIEEFDLFPDKWFEVYGR